MTFIGCQNIWIFALWNIAIDNTEKGLDRDDNAIKIPGLFMICLL